jgi:y4mF family transcriptional regulator
MKHPILSTEELGVVVRAVRKSAGIRQDDLAALAGVSKQFAADVEHGKPTAQIGLVMKLLSHLGLTLSLNVPESALPELQRLQVKNARGDGSDSSASGSGS